MVAYSFQTRFVAQIEADEKLQTVRANRKRHARTGETLQLYEGMRTRHCRLIGVRQCLSVHPILIGVASDLILVGLDYPLPTIETARYALDFDYKAVEPDDFAKLDGFSGWRSMKDFWGEAHPLPEDQFFMGVVIEWAPAAGAAERSAGLDTALAEMGVR